MNSFKDIIKQNRIKNNITLRSFADKIGISPSYLSEIENGKKPPPDDNIVKKMCNVLFLNYTQISKIIHEELIAIKIKKLFKAKKEFLNYVKNINKWWNDD